MDAFESVRLAARTLRNQLVVEGEALPSARLVEEAAKRLDLEIFHVAPDNPQLKGGRACFDMQSGTICCANDCTEAERSALVAHELAHAQLDALSAVCSARDVDVSQPLELAPVGLQRVEDYGQRERRELQANVFARELLLPHDEARRLYLQDSLDTEAIGARCDLPLSLVRQQVLDAVLLPTVEVKPADMMATPRMSDASQKRAADHRGSPFLLQAGPGTGKTHALVHRVAGLIGEGVDPSSIAIMTFSNRAAGELHERLARTHPSQAPTIWIGTFHAFGLDLLRRYHDRLGLSADPTLYDRSDGIAMLEEELPILGLKHYRDLWNPARELRQMLVAISRAKDEMMDEASYRDLGQRMLDSATSDEAQASAEKALEVARVYERYQARLREQDAVDFGDLVMRPALLLEAHADVRMAVQTRHRHVLVDEYQDVNRASTRLLAAVAGVEAKRLWVVGDSRQSIYRFRGASSSNMKRFLRDNPRAATDQLGTNYRCSEELVDVLVAAAPKMQASEGQLALQFTSSRGTQGNAPEIHRVDMPSDELEAIASAIIDLRRRGVPLEKQAVLCRSNPKLTEVASALEARGIPVLHLGSIFEREEIRDLLSVLSLVIDRRGDGLVRVGRMPRYNLSLEDVQKTLAFLRADTTAAGPRLHTAANDAGLSAEGREKLNRLATDLDGFTAGTSPWEVLTTFVLDRARVVAGLATAPSVVTRMRAVAVWQFLNFAKHPVPGRGPRIRRLLNRVRMMVLLAEERDLRRVPAAALHLNAVRLMTVHASKGLEFEAVHLPGMTKASFPAQRQGDPCPPPHGMVEDDNDPARAHEEEEQCLFFVAMSRARNHLYLYASAKQANGRNRSPSEYLAWLHGLAVERKIRPSPAAMDLILESASLASLDSWKLTNEGLETYDRCPRRFLYTHLLGLGTARTSTAYGATKLCLFELIEWATTERATRLLTEAEVLAKLSEIWATRGPKDHAFAADYELIAERIARNLVKSWDERGLQARRPLELQIEGTTVSVTPHEIATSPTSATTLRRIRLGYRRKKEEDVGYDLLDLAGAAAGLGHHEVEVVHLTDGVREPILYSEKARAKSTQWLREAVVEILAGRFPAKPDSYTCPQCPHFFVCPSLPSGTLLPAEPKK